jgi:hypothetical protein
MNSGQATFRKVRRSAIHEYRGYHIEWRQRINLPFLTALQLNRIRLIRQRFPRPARIFAAPRCENNTQLRTLRGGANRFECGLAFPTARISMNSY